MGPSVKDNSDGDREVLTSNRNLREARGRWGASGQRRRLIGTDSHRRRARSHDVLPAPMNRAAVNIDKAVARVEAKLADGHKHHARSVAPEPALLKERRRVSAPRMVAQ